MGPTDQRLQLGRYELYKAGTKKIVDWLTRNASRYIDISPFVTVGKSSTTSKISARALVSLAEVIVSTHRTSNPLPTGITTTSTITKLIREVIDGRQASADWYATQPTSDEAELGNEAHRFFIEILREIHSLLISVQQPKKTASDSHSNSSTSKNAEQDINNLFSQLELEEPSASPLGNAQKLARQLPKSRTPIAKIALDDEAGNKEFALYCHLEDLRDVRQYIRGVWLDYASGAVSLLTAAMVTETAFGMMRIADERFVAIYKSFGDWWFLPEFMSFDAYNEGSITLLISTKDKANASASTQRQDLIDLICPSEAFMLRDLALKVKEAKAGGDLLQVLNPLTECYDFDFILNSNIFTLIHQSQLFGARCPERTTRQSHERAEFVFGLINYLIDGDTPLWLVSACQIYRSIYNIIGSNPFCASEEYLTKMKQLKSQLPFQPRGREHGRSGWDVLDCVFKDLKPLESLMRVTLDKAEALSEAKGDWSQTVAWMHENMGRPLACLEGMPCFPGQLLYFAKAKLHQIGVAWANKKAVILAMAHLYTNCRKYGLVKGTWQDMELIISQHKAATPLVPRSTKNADCFTPLRHYLLCLGVPATEFSRGRIPKLPTANHIKKHSRQIIVTSAYMTTLFEGQLNVEQLGFSREDPTETTLKQLADSSKEGQSSRQHTLVELLSALKKVMIKDEPSLNFNYFGFYTICSAFLMSVGQQMNWELEPYAIVHRLLEDATSASSQSKSVASSMLGVTASVLDKLILTEGNKFTQEAFNQSSGRIPKSMRPILADHIDSPDVMITKQRQEYEDVAGIESNLFQMDSSKDPAECLRELAVRAQEHYGDTVVLKK